MTTLVTLILLSTACGKDAIPTSPQGPEQNALVSVVRVYPSAAVIEPDGQVSLDAVVKGARGQTVNGRPVTWSSSDASVAYVDAQGRIVAGSEGTATITANVLGVAGKATIDVRGTVTEILIDPLEVLDEGEQDRLTATLVYSNGATRPGYGLRWQSFDPSRLWIDGDGDAIARVAGDVDVEVRGRGKSGSRRIRVGSGDIVSVDVRTGSSVLEVGETGTVWADVTSARGDRVSRNVTWTSSHPSVATADGKGHLTARSEGTTTIIGSVGGVSGSLDISVVDAGGSGDGGGGGGGSAGPGTVSDLAVGQEDERSIEIRFTEVGDGRGSPASYEVRYGLASGFDWSEAVLVSKGSCRSPLAGEEIGRQRSCRVEGLVAAEDYAFQIAAFRSDDEAFGDPSNVATGRTADAAIVVDVTPSSFQLEIGETQQLNAGIYDSYGNDVEGTPSWTSTVSSVVSVAASGRSATASGNATGQATIRATYSGVADGSSATVTQPIEESDGSDDDSSGGSSAPPPASGQHFVGDFSSANSDTELYAMVNVATQGNVHAEPGVGMRYDFIARPNHCGDQALSSKVDLPSGTREVWMRFRIRFSQNWTTRNDNCSTPAPDYKTVLTWLGDRSSVSGHERFDLKIGQGVSNIHASGPGWPGSDVVPVSVVQRPGATALADDRWHTVEIHQQLVGDDEIVFQMRIDGGETHNYSTRTTSGLSSNWLSRVNIGANRNLGATSLMHVWWDDFEVWVGANPGGFSFGSPTSY